ncbi:MAG: PAS domain-containing protein [Methanobacterium sp.]
MKTKILIVEDEAITAMDIKNRLNNNGLEVVGIASKGKEAIKKAEELKPDIILMDITLKGDMDGIEAAEEITSLFNIPVIYMSAFADENTFEKLKITNPYGFVNKPVSSELLLISIEAAVYKHEFDKKLIESEEKYRRWFEEDLTGDFIATPEGQLLECNLSFLEIYGFKNYQEAIGWDISKFNPNGWDDVVNSLKNGIKICKHHSWHERPDGKKIYVVANLAGVFDDFDELVQVKGYVFDDTKRKNTEESMQRDKERLKLAQIAAGAGLWDWNIKTGHIKWSKLMFELFGLDPKKNKASFEAWDKVLHPEDMEIAHKRIETAIEEHNLLDSDYRIVLPDGQVKWINALGKAEYDDQDSPIYMIGICIDITERKKSEEALKQSQWELVESQRVTKTGNWSFDILNGNIKWSEELYRIFEVQKSEFDEEYKTFISYVHPEDRKLVKETNKNAREKGTNFKVEYRILTPHGEKFIQEIGYSTKNDFGEVVRLFGTAQDITERKKAEISLIEAHNNLEKKVQERTAELENAYDEVSDLYNNAPCGYHSLDKEGYFIQINDTELKWLDYSREEIIGKKKFTDIITEESQKTFQMNFPRFKEHGEVYDLEFDMIRKDGSILPVLLNATAVEDSDGNYIMSRSTIFDISERKKSENQLKEIVKELELSNQELQQFAYVSFHDLQEPLRTIASFTQLLQRRYEGKLDSDADEFMDYIVEAAIRMKQQIQDLLDYSSVATKDEKFKPVNTNNILNETLKTMKTIIKESNAEIEYDYLPNVIGDAGQLQRVFQNLISNALKFKKCEETPTIHISAFKDKENKEYVFSVKDNGIGIEEQYKERIFTIFQRLHTRDVYEGTGIGLSIVKRIIERHGGRIWVESEFGVGSTFYFTLPIEKLKLGGGILTNSN